MNIKVFLLICSFTISTCLGNTIYYLHESTDIIRTLIENKQLSLILEDVNQENLALLINNYSPAIIALESEAFNSTLPVILFFYKESDTTYKKILNLFVECSDIYANRLKCIAIDVDKLPAIAQAFKVQSTPAVSTMIQREEVEFIETDITQDKIYDLAEKLLQAT